MAMSRPVLEGRGLHRFFRRGGDEVAALKDVSVSVAAGETVAVIGPSGSGKSTLLHLLAGLDNPDGGSVWVAGELLSHQSARRRAEIRARLVGVMTQHSGLFDHLTVLGNVRLAASFRASTGEPLPERELLEAVGLSSRAQARPRTLSGGETARAGLAVALAGRPTVLLADEPTAEISRVEEDDLLDLLRAVRPAQAGTLLVTHSARVAAAADRVVELREGREVGP
jgi:putative ABC transport system ATP-binding protein